jgi:hypothetical protein
VRRLTKMALSGGMRTILTASCCPVRGGQCHCAIVALWHCGGYSMRARIQKQATASEGSKPSDGPHPPALQPLLRMG